MQKISPPEDYWATPPYSSPLNRIRSMMNHLDKELSDLYKKKSLEYAANPPKVSPSVRKIGPLFPTINIKNIPSKSTSLASVKGGNASKASLLGSQVPGAFSFERYKRYKNLAMRAYQNRKIFTVYGCYPRIKQALIRRGWVEKVAPGNYKALQAMSQHSLLKSARDGNDAELVAISKLLEKYPTYFIWQPKGLRDGYGYALPYRNRVRRSREFDFTTKEGLIGCIENSHFFSAEGVAEVRAPRCHRLALTEEVSEFLDDYRLTYCRSLLQYINTNAPTKELYNSTSGTIPLSVVQFALDRIMEAMEALQHDDIDIPTGKEKVKDAEEWKSFVINTNRVINQVEKFKGDFAEFSKIIANCKRVLLEARAYWPTMDTDGYNNIWILKPAYCCRGTGIIMMKDYDNMIAFSKRRIKMRYVVQKYIERPLLIYKTKFDIRQYILVTVNENVNIWIYRDCYLKFSSQEFNLNDFRESVHITNNTVQKRYKNGVRSELLPPHNMWHLSQFQNYLKSIGKEDIWHKTIFPSMKQNVISVVLSSLDETDLIPNNFEMYGCDFMLDENFNTWLIEINATPDLNASTCVTAKICPAVQDDIIKVVVDIPKNPKATTGNFELIYKLPCIRVPTYVAGLTVQGVRMKLLPSSKIEDGSSNLSKSSRKLKLGSAKKKSPPTPKIITENDVNDDINNSKGKDEVDVQVKPKFQPKLSFKKRKVGGQNKILKPEAKLNENRKGKTLQNKKTEFKTNSKSNQSFSAINIVKKSFEILRDLKSHVTNDEIIGKRVKAIVSELYDPNTKKGKIKKTPGRLSAGGTKKVLPTNAKELLALKTLGSDGANDKESKILTDFMDIIFRKMGGG